MPNNTLAVDSILYRIGDRNLLTDIYLQFSKGEIVGLLGRNGCAKSTLLKIIFGTLHTYNKHINVNGTVYQFPFKAQVISYLPQENFLPDSLSLHKIIRIFISNPKNRTKLQQDERLQPHLNKQPNELSGGERRYFEVLLLLNLESPFILLDEPFSAIEPLYKEHIKSQLLAYKHQKGIIVTDHDYRQILGVSNRIILLTDGCTRPIKNVTELEDWHYLPSGALG